MKDFRDCRINQWHHMLDRGSMVNFEMTIKPWVQQNTQVKVEPGWIKQHKIADEVNDDALHKLLSELALTHTLLCEGQVRSSVGVIHLTNLKPIWDVQQDIIPHPYGRALNAVGNINPLLHGRWNKCDMTVGKMNEGNGSISETALPIGSSNSNRFLSLGQTAVPL